EKYGVYKGMVGTIIEAHIEFRSFQVAFIDPNQVVDENDDFLGLRDEIVEYIHVKDMEVVEESDCSDEFIFNDLPNKDIRWFCKVEDGYIKNLRGEKLNKIAYDYDS
ncbi:MAG: hypothetical protein K2G42_02895, partial [Clostridia bacterium]|nr:hypothetical protein [Clostridia bacterium]